MVERAALNLMRVSVRSQLLRQGAMRASAHILEHPLLFTLLGYRILLLLSHGLDKSHYKTVAIRDKAPVTL